MFESDLLYAMGNHQVIIMLLRSMLFMFKILCMLSMKTSNSALLWDHSMYESCFHQNQTSHKHFYFFSFESKHIRVAFSSNMCHVLNLPCFLRKHKSTAKCMKLNLLCSNSCLFQISNVYVSDISNVGRQTSNMSPFQFHGSGSRKGLRKVLFIVSAIHFFRQYKTENWLTSH